MVLTIGGELVPLTDCNAEDILVQIFEKELAVEVPLWVEGVIQGTRGVILLTHGHLAVWFALSCRKRKRSSSLNEPK